jgi:hypothetical protein
MHEAYERILKALNLEKWMTPKQIARLMYEKEYLERWRKPYDRVIKNLQSLHQKDLLRFKDYGLGKENLWALKPHPIVKEFGYEAPKKEIHTFKYEHEKTCADVFVTLALTGRLYDWQAHRKITKDTIPDRIAQMNRTIYIEVEMGSQDKIRQKADSYRRYFYEKKESFHVWFLVKTEKQYDDALVDLKDFPEHYQVSTLDQFHSDMRSDTFSDFAEQ